MAVVELAGGELPFVRLWLEQAAVDHGHDPASQIIGFERQSAGREQPTRPGDWRDAKWTEGVACVTDGIRSAQRVQVDVDHIGHAERLEDPLMQEALERLSRNLLDDE